DRDPGHVGCRRRDRKPSRALLRAAKLVYGLSVSESLYPLPPVTAPITPPMSVAQPEAAESVREEGRIGEAGSADPGPCAPPAPSRRLDRSRGFAVDVEGVGQLGCADIRGFREAALAAVDPRAIAPLRLVLVGPDEGFCDFLVTFAEDVEQVRR